MLLSQSHQKNQKGVECETWFYRRLGAILQSIYLFGVLHRFQHCTGHITMGSWKGRGNQYLEFVRVRIEPRPQRWEARVLPLCHRGPHTAVETRLPVTVAGEGARIKQCAYDNYYLLEFIMHFAY